MPKYVVTVDLMDDYRRQMKKSWETIDLADEAAALAAASGLVTDLMNITEAGVLAYTVSQRVVVANDSPDAGANRDEGLTLVLRKADNYKAAIKVPAPINGIFNQDGTVDLTDVAVNAFVDNFRAVGGNFVFSDGEQAVALLSGKLDK